MSLHLLLHPGPGRHLHYDEDGNSDSDYDRDGDDDGDFDATDFLLLMMGVHVRPSSSLTGGTKWCHGSPLRFPL